MSNVGLVAMFYYGSDVFALTDQHVAPIYKIRLNMKDMLYNNNNNNNSSSNNNNNINNNKNNKSDDINNRNNMC